MPTEPCSSSELPSGSLARESFEAGAMLAQPFGSAVPEIGEGEAIRREHRGADGEQEHRQPVMSRCVARGSVEEDQQHADRKSLKDGEERCPPGRESLVRIGAQKAERPPLVFGVRDSIENVFGVAERRVHAKAKGPSRVWKPTEHAMPSVRECRREYYGRRGALLNAQCRACKRWFSMASAIRCGSPAFPLQFPVRATCAFAFSLVGCVERISTFSTASSRSPSSRWCSVIRS